LNPKPTCRFCNTELHHTFVDLGMSPLCESFLPADQLNQMEPFYPLKVYVCEKCYLVQLPEYVRPESIFTEYAYFSSFSDSWLAHCKKYTELMIERFQLTSKHLVVELGSNDGYLLQYFAHRGIPTLGVEPARNIAKVAVEKGIPTVSEFFGQKLAGTLSQEGKGADLLLWNNVLAQIPDINNFIRGMKKLLKPHGVITMEFPHLMRLVDGNQFDTIYHEHFSYFSWISVEKIFANHGITLFDVEELKSHGGSIRIYGRHEEETERLVTERAHELRQRERHAGYDTMER
jgi:SAM-dependent methyltransferase